MPRLIGYIVREEDEEEENRTPHDRLSEASSGSRSRPSGGDRSSNGGYPASYNDGVFPRMETLNGPRIVAPPVSSAYAGSDQGYKAFPPDRGSMDTGESMSSGDGGP